MSVYRGYLPIILSLFLLLITFGNADATVTTPEVVIIQLEDGYEIGPIVAEFGVELVDAVDVFHLYVLSGQPGLMNLLLADTRVVRASLEQEFHGQPFLWSLGDGLIDPQPFLWSLGDAEGALVDQYATQQIRLAQAQAITGGDEIIVAVLDSGISTTHPHFVERVLAGYDFVDEDDDPDDQFEGIDEDDDGNIDEAAGHGTHVAGIVSLVAPHADILPVRIFGSDGVGTYTDLIEGIVYAVEQGADVINISGSGVEASPFLQMAVEYAAQHGVLIVAAGGINQLGYPASYAEAIAVGASGADDLVLDFALFADGVNAIYAPGESILSAFPGDEYRYWTGNSMATPFVAGLSALMSAVGSCDDLCVSDLIQQTATVIDNGDSSHQRIDAYAAVVEAAFTGRNNARIQALYTFREGGGQTVFDVSGVGAPLDLTIENVDAAYWPTEGGLALIDETMLTSADPAYKLIDATQASEEVTIEAWVVPGTYRQRGPARMFTMSADNNHRNIMLGQIGKRVAARFQTTDTNADGKPNLKSPQKSFLAGLNHVVYSRDVAGNESIFINGELVQTSVRTGSTSSWDAYRLVLGNELTGGKSWLGVYHLVAVYDYAFGPDEATTNFEAGSGIAFGPVTRPFDLIAPPTGETERVSANLQALYDFNTGAGSIVPDVSGIGAPLDLTIADESSVSWLPDGGLSVNAETTIRSAGAATKLTDASRASGELTIEAWITPQDGAMSGPARIVTLSTDKNNRSFTLAQQNRKIDVRLRTTETSDNGLSSVRTNRVLTAGEQVHVVYTRDALGGVRIYVDGALVSSEMIHGSLMFWRNDMLFALASEIDGDKAWLGEYHLVAIYNRALSADEVLHNYEVDAP